MIIHPQPDYELLDSGEKMKLERYGSYILVRPDPQAIWPKSLPEKAWIQADAHFNRTSEDKGQWIKKSQSMPDRWPITLGSIRIFTRLTPFKHTAIFPEQLDNWQWMENALQKSITNKIKGDKTYRPKVLNLFGYTGGASVTCAKVGAQVTHVDASRSAITWAKENMLETDLDENTIRWILDDAVAFVKKELKRGNKYDAIIMDPPVFGRGAKGEVWKIEEDLIPLLDLCYQLLTPDPIFFILNGYASGYSATAYANNLQQLCKTHGGEVEAGELLIKESDKFNEAKHISVERNIDSRFLPCGIVARWRKV